MGIYTFLTGVISVNKLCLVLQNVAFTRLALVIGRSQVCNFFLISTVACELSSIPLLLFKEHALTIMYNKITSRFVLQPSKFIFDFRLTFLRWSTSAVDKASLTLSLIRLSVYSKSPC